jgi:hypothetical protein
MQNAVEEIRNGIQEIHDLLEPIGVKLDNLDQKVSVSRVTFESKTFELEARIVANAAKISEQAIKSQEHSSQIASLFEQVKSIQGCLKISRQPEKPADIDSDGRVQA